MKILKPLIRFIFIFAIIIATNIAYGQNQWIHYTPNNSGLPGYTVTEIIIDSVNTKWFATNNGLARLRGNTWTVWNKASSPLRFNFIVSIAKDKNNVLWVATQDSGLYKFDGINWTEYYNTNVGFPLKALSRVRIDEDNTVWACSKTLGIFKHVINDEWIRYHTGNSGLPHNTVNDVKFEGNIKWIGTTTGGVAKFNDTTWLIYNALNTPLLSTFIQRIGIDNFNNKWFCTRFGGVAKFSSSQDQWTIFTPINSGLPGYNISCIFFDENNTKWIGIEGTGFTIFNDTNWVTALDTNTTSVFDIKKDRYNNIWIGADGVWVYNPIGIVNVENNNSEIPKEFELYQNYPNPFNPDTKIGFSIRLKQKAKLIVYNILGKEIEILMNEIKEPGKHEIIFRSDYLPSGIYFYKLETENYSVTKRMILIK